MGAVLAAALWKRLGAAAGGGGGGGGGTWARPRPTLACVLLLPQAVPCNGKLQPVSAAQVRAVLP